MPTIDLNCDMGEGMPHDAQLMAYITSASIACGGHAGDMRMMRRTVRLARKYGVAVGAHPGFPDRRNFGRKPLDISLEALKKSLESQVKALEQIALFEGEAVGYVKPHGALYSLAMDDECHAKCLVQLAAAGRRNVALVGMPHSALEHLCKKSGVTFVREAFPDRAYDEKGKLVPRGNYGAVFSDPSEVARRAVEIPREHGTPSISGEFIRLPGIRTLCIHSDSPNAVESARRSRIELEKAGFTVEPHSTIW